MNAIVVCLCAVLPSLPSLAYQSDFSPLTNYSTVSQSTDLDADSGPLFKSRDPELVFRAQSPMMTPQFGGDPFLQPPGAMDPYAGLPGGGFLFGANGPQPFRLGAQAKLDMFYTPEEGTTLGSKFESWGFDIEIENTQPSALIPGSMFSLTPQFGMRNFNGPDAVDMPEQVFRGGLDFKWESAAGPSSWIVAFNPSINSDFEDNLTSDAFNWDAKAMMVFQLGGGWRGVAGVGYWDRMRDLIVPHAGFIYADDRWEARLTVPEAQISYFVGNELGNAKWLYLRGEYRVESYEVARAGTRDQMETSDYRIMFGTKMDTGRMNWHLEGGWIFERDVRFKSAGSNFDVSPGFITQFGVRF